MSTTTWEPGEPLYAHPMDRNLDAVVNGGETGLGNYVRPMFEVIDDFGIRPTMSHDAARWPDPFGFHDLDGEDA